MEELEEEYKALQHSVSRAGSARGSRCNSRASARRVTPKKTGKGARYDSVEVSAIEHASPGKGARTLQRNSAQENYIPEPKGYVTGRNLSKRLALEPGQHNQMTARSAENIREEEPANVIPDATLQGARLPY